MCTSKICSLNAEALTSLQKIKEHCISCVPEQSTHGVKACDGKLLNDDCICTLHQYRLGHNPKRRGIGNPRAHFAL